MSSDAISTVLARLEECRKDLLDLGLRNPLINFRPSKRTLEIVDELSSEVFRILVVDGRPMTFRALPNAKADALDTEIGLTGSQEQLDWSQVFGNEDSEVREGPAARHTDTKLQSRLRPDTLTTRLIKIHSLARTYVEEQGVSVLYLALGFLHWYESESSQEEHKAPLMLVPVELQRTDVRERFKLAYAQEEIGTNLSLQAKLKAEFGISLPDLAFGDDFKIDAYLAEVAKKVSRDSRWRVEPNEMYLGFFSFGKFWMYKDLEIARWPNGKAAAQNPVITALLDSGFREPSTVVLNDAFFDDVIAPETVKTVADADSTQMAAIVDVLGGRNLIIQGPPGTGKSQTITNLISAALGENKKVLFVSEKMAALDVVKRRLDALGLGDAVLELHSNKTQKKVVLEELERTLNLGRPNHDGSKSDLRTLASVRTRLNDYCKAINEPIANSGVTPVVAIGKLLDLNRGGESLVRFEFAEMGEWSAADFRERRVLVEELGGLLDRAGAPSKNPFWGSGLRFFNPLDREGLQRSIAAAAKIVRHLEERANEMANALCVGPVTSAKDVEAECRAARRVLAAPLEIDRINVQSRDWIERGGDVGELLRTGQQIAALRAQFSDRLIDAAWDQEILSVRQGLANYGEKWWRFLSRDFRDSKARLADLCRGSLPKGYAQRLALVDTILEAQRAHQIFDPLAPLGRDLFGGLWKGIGSDWTQLAQITQWVSQLHREIEQGELPGGVLSCLARGVARDRLRTQVEQLERLSAGHGTARRALAEKLALGESADAAAWSFRDEVARLETWAAELNSLDGLVRFNQLTDAFSEVGIASLARAAESWDSSGAEYVKAFERTWYEGLFKRAYGERAALQQFDGTSHEQAIATFGRLDRELLGHVRDGVMQEHWRGMPNLSGLGGGEVAILRREINKRRKRLPIRQLIDQAGRAIQAMKPVFMMSPMSIASYIPPGSVDFDLVIFDEASQVRPADAFGALLRGHQAVVVGDSKQLPPTNFFNTLAGDVETEDEDDQGVAVLESVLGLFDSKGAPSKMLRWHYRSQHESLIAVSNHEFYKDDLVIFPSPGTNPHARGLIFNHVKDTEYDRGKTRTNRGEAKAVAEAVMRHAHEHPDLSLGVATFSGAQRDAVLMELELMRREDASGEAFFAAHPAEPFFVKNLENVQGDERDVILISVGYGKTKEGYLAMGFGPLNRDGGERRLNVLISRARLACEVFANFTADDMDLNRSRQPGVVALKNFLTYAKDRRLLVASESGRPPDSPFELAVMGDLARAGYDVVPQVGCAGFFIDIGVRDAEFPGRYLLGIECDGASYHCAKSARDRDRLRESVLRSLGWELHHIWSTDWFKNPKEELNRALAAIERAKLVHKRRLAREGVATAEAGDKPDEDFDPVEEDTRGPNGSVIRELSRDCSVAPQEAASRYNLARPRINLQGRQLHNVLPSDVAKWVKDVVSIEGPIHISEVASRITEAAGLQRAGSRIRQTVSQGARFAEKAGWIARRKDFLWPPDLKAPEVRDRSELPGQKRKIEYVAPEEIEQAITKVVKSSFTIDIEDAIKAVLALLGFNRVTRHMITRMRVHVNALIKSGTLIKRADTGSLTFLGT